MVDQVIRDHIGFQRKETLDVLDFDSQRGQVGKVIVPKKEFKELNPLDLLPYETKLCKCDTYSFKHCRLLQGANNFVTMHFGCDWSHAFLHLFKLNGGDYVTTIFNAPVFKKVTQEDG